MILWSKQVELDKATRKQMHRNEVWNDEFYIILLIVLMIFMVGFIAGNFAHDDVFHPVESINSRNYDIELK